jgi:thioester reductase-like protein
MAADTILITGYPGFLAGRLLPLLREQEPEAKLVALVEPRMMQRAAELVPDGLEILAGDITHPTLGLDPKTYRGLADRLRAVVHLAAVYDLAVGPELAERVNVGGTANVLALCAAAPHLQRHHYISTAYVAGLRSGLVMESDLAAGQSFKNFYESTKFAAEVLVRATMEEIPTTVYRPAIVVGDSQTGETQKFDGPYYLLRAMGAKLGPLRPQMGPGEVGMNVVPVDFVVQAILAGMREPSAEGKTLHLVDPDPTSSADVLRVLMAEYDGNQPNITLPPGLAAAALRLKPVRMLFNGVPPESVRYLNHPVKFDTTVATEVLGKAGLRCPHLPEYAAAMVRFYRAHEHDPAFRPAHER